MPAKKSAAAAKEKPQATPPGHMTIATAATLLMVSERWIRALVRAKAIPTPVGGCLPVAETVRGYIAFLTDYGPSRDLVASYVAAGAIREAAKVAQAEAARLVQAIERGTDPHAALADACAGIDAAAEELAAEICPINRKKSRKMGTDHTESNTYRSEEISRIGR